MKRTGPITAAEDKKIREFFANNPPRQRVRSPVAQYVDPIKKAKDDGYTWQQIAELLASVYGVKFTKLQVQVFWHRHQKRLQEVRKKKAAVRPTASSRKALSAGAAR